jgi:hypothetical protein
MLAGISKVANFKLSECHLGSRDHSRGDYADRQRQTLEALTLVFWLAGEHRVAAFATDVPAVHMSNHRAELNTHNAIRTANNLSHFQDLGVG